MAAEKLRQYQYQQTLPKRTIEQRPTHLPSKQSVKKPLFTKGEKFLYSLGVIILAVFMIVVVQFSSSIDSLNRDIQVLNNNIENVKLENETLTAEVKTLSMPSRILSIAEQHGLKSKNATVKQASQMN